MNQTAAKRVSRGNQSMEVFRLIASILVLFVHVPFSGNLSAVINCLARCAVPGFLAISGFFCYGASARKLRRRLWGLVKLTVAAFGLELLWNCVLIELEGGSSIGYVRAVLTNVGYYRDFLLMNTNPLRDTLWYLPAAMEVMALLWVYVGLHGTKPVSYRWFYLAGLALFVWNLILGVLEKFTAVPVSILQYRNAWLFGIPMTAMGLFLGEHWKTLLARFRLDNRRLAVLVLACLGVSFWEWYGLGGRDVMIGSVSAVFFLLLLMLNKPVLSTDSRVSGVLGIFGTVSTVVYVSHGVAGDFCQMFLPDMGIPLPLVTLALSLTAGVLWAGICAFRKRVRK